MSAYARRNATVPSAGARVREGRIYNKFWNILGNFGQKENSPAFQRSCLYRRAWIYCATKSNSLRLISKGYLSG